MRRPPLTNAVVAGLESAIPLLVGDYESMDDGWPPKEIAGVKRAIDYLEALTYWHQQRQPTNKSK